MSRHPDIILILTDQERAPPPYEGEAIASWRRDVLTGRRWFDEHGVSFERHYTGSLACVPSRPTLLTGHYPDVHGVTQTDGLGKDADDARMRWLRPGEVPTLGNWFRAGGYDTHYDGKWHVSHADLTDPESGKRFATNTRDGAVLSKAVQAYLDADPLEPFGFSGWVGPEPHGARASDTGLVRDPLTAARVVAWLEARYERRRKGDADARRPFLLVASFVNPHDICFFPAWALRSPLARSSRDPPPVPPAPTEHQTLADQPAAHAAYRASYLTAYGPGFLIDSLYRLRAQAYRDLYHRLHAEVDGPIDRVRRAVTEGGSDDALLVRTADHGELLGAHGGLHQKWFNLYDEATRVPLYIAGIGACATRAKRIADMPTSHVDLLPTLLSAAGLDGRDLSAKLRPSFSELHALPGCDLMPHVQGDGAPDTTRAVYLMTRDDVLEGSEQRSLMWRRMRVGTLATSIREPLEVGSTFEAIVVRVADAEARGGAGHLWKLVRNFDDPSTWSEPGVRQRLTRGRDTRFREQPLPDEWELYDLDVDPTEAHNAVRAHPPVFEHLRRRLETERTAVVPRRNRPWPYVTEPDVGTIAVRRSRILADGRAHVWATLADFGALSSWVPNVDDSRLLDPKAPVGVGSVRRVKVGPMKLHERIMTWTPEAELAYRIDGLPKLARSVVNAWRLESTRGGTRVTLTTTVEAQSWPLGRPVASLLGARMARVSEELLDALVARHRGPVIRAPA